MNTIGYFEIQSSEPGREINFYGKIFGWKFTKQETAPIEYYHIEAGGIPGGLLKRPAPVPPPEMGTNAFVCTIETENFDQKAQQITDNGGKVMMAKFAIPGKCWQGYFLDPDNNCFGLFQADEQAK